MVASRKQSEGRNFRRDGGATVRMWLSLIGGGLAWTVHLVFSATLAEWGISASLDNRMFMGVNHIAWVVMTVTGVSLAATLWALWGSAKLLNHFRQQLDLKMSVDNAEATQEFADSSTGVYLMRVGICSNCVFLLVILAQSLSVFFYSGAG